MADSVELRMNVTSIKRVDPYVKDILATATHVALYKYNLSKNVWERKDTEGALFIYSRNGEPYHNIMVMNRLNTNNVIEPIIKDFDYQMQAPFLLYRNSKRKIYGIWFYNREECIHITFLIETIMESLKDKTNEKNKKQENGVDIFSLLSKAQEDFNKTPTKQNTITETTSSTTTTQTTPGPAFSTPRVHDCTSKSVMDFFAKASTKTTQKQMVVTGDDGENVLQRLMSNPAHSVEHIEKQQRSITPQEQVQIKQKPERRSIPISFPSTNQSKIDTENSLNLGISPPNQTTTQGQSPLAFLLQGTQQQKDAASTTTTTTEQIESSPFARFLDSAQQKPQLMTPMMFTAATTIAQTLTTPQSSSSTTTTTKIDKDIDLLTEKQLAQALIHLLKTNPNFTRQIHEAYVNSIMEKCNLNNNNSLI